MIVKMLYCNLAPEFLIEQAGRTCYQSQDKITEQSHENFCKMLIKSGHESVIEHSFASFRIIGLSRACSHQLVRHRLFSFCLSGDTKILRFTLGNKKHLTIKQIYEWSKNPRKKQYLKKMDIRSVNHNNIIVKNKIKDVFYSGKKEVYEIKTKLNYIIKASKDHIFFNKNGEIKLGDLHPGDKVFINGISLYQEKEWLSKQYNIKNTSEIAQQLGVSKSTIKKWKNIHKIPTLTKYKKRLFTKQHRFNISVGNLGKTRSEMVKQKYKISKLGNKNPMFKHNLEDLTKNGFYRRSRKKIQTKCELCNSLAKEVHHIDKNIKNFNDDNLLSLCVGCHKLVHKGYNIKKVVEDEIISIKLIGVEDTYDIEMENPYHNFIANGFMVHNSQKSQRYVREESFEYVIPDSIKKDPLLLAKYENAMLFADNLYKELLDAKIKPEDARYILPNACTTELVMSGNFRNWRWFLKERLSKAAQWEIRIVAEEIKNILIQQAPNIFGDI